jgi:hypothetical protein
MLTKKENEEMLKKLLLPAVFVVLLGAGLLTLQSYAQKGTVDLVVFSYDRPLQLYAFLESADSYLTGVSTVSVIYRATDKEYAQGYAKVKKQFPDVTFLRQSSQPYQDFKPLVMKASFESPASYIMYGVDDIVVTDHVDLYQVVSHLEATKAYGFYLRLGTHIDECYMLQKQQRIPPLKPVGDGVYAWTFAQAEGDWAYPNTQDMTVYRKKDIEQTYKRLPFISPNSCEGQWSSCADMSKQGLCFASAKIVNIPMNLVQTIYPNNRNMALFSAQDLLAKFNEGLKMDIRPLYKSHFKSVHVEYVPTFVQRA